MIAQILLSWADIDVVFSHDRVQNEGVVLTNLGRILGGEITQVRSNQNLSWASSIMIIDAAFLQEIH